MKKLTDEQLSRVLSQHAAGQLSHRSYVNVRDGVDCSCVAGAALILPATDDTFPAFPASAALISAMVSDAQYSMDERGFHGRTKTLYPEATDDMLRLLEKAGLA